MESLRRKRWAFLWHLSASFRFLVKILLKWRHLKASFFRNPSPKKAVGFFFKGDKPAAANGTIFVATILGNAAYFAYASMLQCCGPVPLHWYKFLYRLDFAILIFVTRLFSWYHAQLNSPFFLIFISIYSFTPQKMSFNYSADFVTYVGSYCPN